MSNSNKSLFQELQEIGLECNLGQGQGFCSASNLNSDFNNASKSNNNLNAVSTKCFSNITNKSLLQELDEIGSEFNLGQGQGFCSASNFNSDFNSAAKVKTNDLNAESTNSFSSITNKSLIQELGEIESEFNLGQGQGFCSALNFDPDFNSMAKSKINNFNSEFTNGFSKPLQSTSFAPAIQLDGLKSGSKGFKPAIDIDKENNIDYKDMSSSGSNLPNTPQNTPFSNTNSSQNNNSQSHKLPLSSNFTNTQNLPGITKPKLKSTQTNPNQRFSKPKLQVPSLLNKNSTPQKTGVSLHNGQDNSLSKFAYSNINNNNSISKKFVSPMKKPLPDSASKKASSGFRPFVSPYKPQSKNSVSEIPTKRPINAYHKPTKRFVYSNCELYDPAKNIEREKAINLANKSTQQNMNQAIRPNTSNVPLLNSQQTYMATNSLFDTDSIGPLYENEITQWQRSELDPEILEMDLEKAVNYKFTSKPATSSITAAHIGSSLDWVQISDILDKLSSINKKQLDEWVKNQYSMLVWKTASYVRSYPIIFSSYWDWSFIFEQVKIRFRQEILEKKSSCLKMIVEYMSPSLRYFIAIVSKVTIEENNAAEIVISDGWYTIKCRLDGVLTKAVNSGAITTGMKLAICGAALESPGYMPILESHNEVELKINGNGTRRAKWDAKLGFQDGLYYPIHLSNIDPMGGNITAVDVVVLRKYPLKYVETINSDKKIFRTESEEIQYCADLEEKYQNYDAITSSSPPESPHREVSCSFKVLVKDSNCQHGNQYAVISFWNTTIEVYDDLNEFTRLAFFNLRPYSKPNMKNSNIVQVSTTNTTKWKAQELSETLDVKSDKNFRHILIPGEFDSYEVGQDIDLIAWYAGNILNGQCFIDQKYNVYLVQLSPYTSKDYFLKLKIGQITGLTDLKRGPRDEQFNFNIIRQYTETKVYKKSNIYFKERWTQMEKYSSINESSIKQKIEELQGLNTNIQLGNTIALQFQKSLDRSFENPADFFEKCGKIVELKYLLDQNKIVGRYCELESNLIKFILDIENWIEITKNAYSELILSEFKSYLIEKLSNIDLDNCSTLTNMIQSMGSVEDCLTKIYKLPVEEVSNKWNTSQDDILACRYEFVDLLSYQLMTNIYLASFSKLSYPSEANDRKAYFKIQKLQISSSDAIVESMAKLFI